MLIAVGLAYFRHNGPCILWFSALNNALNRISLDTLWFISAWLPTHIDEFSSQGSAILKQGKHLLPSGIYANHTMSIGNSGGLNSLVMSREAGAEADSSTCCGFLAASTDKLLRGYSSQALWTSLGHKFSLRWENTLICTATGDIVVPKLCATGASRDRCKQNPGIKVKY